VYLDKKGNRTNFMPYTQDKCDSMLRNKIMEECLNAGGHSKDCNTVSGVYYDALHAAGKKGYGDARSKK
jgi:hypothetical protein